MMMNKSHLCFAATSNKSIYKTFQKSEAKLYTFYTILNQKGGIFMRAPSLKSCKTNVRETNILIMNRHNCNQLLCNLILFNKKGWQHP